MNIIYVANLSDNKASGINKVVPLQMKYQAKYANIGFFNFRKTTIEFDSKITILNNKSTSEFNLNSFDKPFNEPDIVIISNIFSTMKLNLVAKQLYRENIPYVIVPHGCFAVEAMKKGKWKKRIAIHTLMKKLVYKADAIQYLSEQERKNSYVNNKPIIIPNGVEVPNNENLKFTYNKNLKFVFIGRKVIKIKGIDYLLKACKIAAPYMRKSNAKMFIYGPDYNGSFKKIDSIISKYNINDIVFNKEGVYGIEKEKILKNASVFVLTSRTEGQPTALYEACSYGLPVLTTPGTNIQGEIDKKNFGWNADFTEKDVAKKIIHIINNIDEIKKKSKNAYKYVSNEFNWDKISKNAIKKYKEIIELY